MIQSRNRKRDGGRLGNDHTLAVSRAAEGTVVAGYHLIWTIYGSWLPNDPRGSSSKEIRNAAIADLGELHFGRKQVQPAGREIREFYDAAIGRLKHPVRPFGDAEISILGQTFGDVILKHAYTCYACAILPDHVHILIRKHRDLAEIMIENLQDASRLATQEAWNIDHPIWGGCGWKVFLETAHDIRRVIAYINKNPTKANRCSQSWDFVKPYDGWLPGGATLAKPRARRRPQS
jgi:REP element-mobilizing transposase RayT